MSGISQGFCCEPMFFNFPNNNIPQSISNLVKSVSIVLTKTIHYLKLSSTLFFIGWAKTLWRLQINLQKSHWIICWMNKNFFLESFLSMVHILFTTTYPIYFVLSIYYINFVSNRAKLYIKLFYVELSSLHLRCLSVLTFNLLPSERAKHLFSPYLETEFMHHHPAQPSPYKIYL